MSIYSFIRRVARTSLRLSAVSAAPQHVNKIAYGRDSDCNAQTKYTFEKLKRNEFFL